MNKKNLSIFLGLFVAIVSASISGCSNNSSTSSSSSIQPTSSSTGFLDNAPEQVQRGFNLIDYYKKKYPSMEDAVGGTNPKLLFEQVGNKMETFSIPNAKHYNHVKFQIACDNEKAQLWGVLQATNKKKNTLGGGGRCYGSSGSITTPKLKKNQIVNKISLSFMKNGDPKVPFHYKVYVWGFDKIIH